MEQPDGTATPAVAATSVGKSYSGTAVLTDLSFSVPVGTITGFIGPSGCGKTTLVRLMTGISTPSTGTMLVQGRNPEQLSRGERQDIGYLPQAPVLFQDLSVWQNLGFHASLYGVRLRRRTRLREMLDLVELEEHRRKRVRDLSGGMKRRLALAAALVHDPRLVFLDEPTAGIDPILRRKLWDRFRALRDAGRTLVVTTQYVGEAAWCDQVAVLSEGRLVVVDSPDGLRRAAGLPELVDVETAVAVPDALVHELVTLPGATGQVRRTGPLTLRVGVAGAAEAMPRLTSVLEERGVRVVAASEHVPDFDEVFVEVIERHRSTLGAQA